MTYSVEIGRVRLFLALAFYVEIATELKLFAMVYSVEIGRVRLFSQ